MRIDCPDNIRGLKELKTLVDSHGRIRVTLRDIQRDEYKWNDLFHAIDPASEYFELNFLSNQVFFSNYYEKKLQVFFIGANITRNDPFEVLSFFRKSDFVNQSGVNDPFVDNLMSKSAQALSSDEVRKYAEIANNWVVSSGYALPLFSKRFRGCIQSGLEGYNLSSLGPLSVDYSEVKLGQ